MADKTFRWNDSQRDILRKILLELQDGMEINTGNLTVEAISGAIADNAPETENPIPTAGKAVTGASYAPAYTAGDRAVIPIDKDSGGVLTHNRALSAAADQVAAVGDIAHDSNETNAQGPVKLGAVARAGSALQTSVSVGDRTNLVCDQNGRLVVIPAYKDNATIFTSAARTTTQTSSLQTTHYSQGLKLFWHISAGSSLQLTLTVEARDNLTGQFITILTSAQQTGTGVILLQIHPALTPVANLAVSALMPQQYRVVITHGNANSATYSVNAEYV